MDQKHKKNRKDNTDIYPLKLTYILLISPVPEAPRRPVCPGPPEAGPGSVAWPVPVSGQST